jgi:hypothetical protein
VLAQVSGDGTIVGSGKSGELFVITVDTSNNTCAVTGVRRIGPERPLTNLVSATFAGDNLLVLDDEGSLWQAPLERAPP